MTRPGKLGEVVLLAVRPTLPSSQPRRRRGKEAGGLGRTAGGAEAGAPEAGSAARGPGSGWKNGGGERGGEVPRWAAVRSRPALRSGPSRPRGPGVRSARAHSPRSKSRRLTLGESENSATLREKCSSPCNTPRKRKMSGDDGGGRVTYPCCSRG